MGILKEIMQAIISTESDFCNILSQTNYEFYNFRNEIIRLGKKANRGGYDNLFFIQLNILDSKNKSTKEYNVALSLYYKTDNEKTVKKYERKYTIFGFSGMPESVANSLKEKGELKIDFEANDIHEFFDNKDLDINIAKIPLNILVKDELKPEKTLKGESILIKIQDFILYYRVQIFSNRENENKYIKEFLTSYIIGIEDDSILKALNNEGQADFTISPK